MSDNHPPTPEEREAKRFDEIWERVTEHFPDAVLVTRGKNIMLSRATDPTWALGAVIFLEDDMRESNKEITRQQMNGGQPE